MTPDEWIAEGAVLRGLSAGATALLGVSTWERLHLGDRRLDVLCPAGTTFDAAEALRLELVDRVSLGVTVDVQIAPPSEPLGPEDAAGYLLHVSERAERLAGPVFVGVDLASGEDEVAVQVVSDDPFASPRVLSSWTTVPLAVALDALKDHTAIETTGEPAPSLDDPYPWDEPEGAR